MGEEADMKEKKDNAELNFLVFCLEKNLQFCEF